MYVSQGFVMKVVIMLDKGGDEVDQGVHQRAACFGTWRAFRFTPKTARKPHTQPATPEGVARPLFFLIYVLWYAVTAHLAARLLRRTVGY